MSRVLSSCPVIMYRCTGEIALVYIYGGIYLFIYLSAYFLFSFYSPRYSRKGPSEVVHGFCRASIVVVFTAAAAGCTFCYYFWSVSLFVNLPVLCSSLSFVGFVSMSSRSLSVSFSAYLCLSVFSLLSVY